MRIKTIFTTIFVVVIGTILIYAISSGHFAFKGSDVRQYPDHFVVGYQTGKDNGLLNWAYNPKETWHQHFQAIFEKYKMSRTVKTYPEIKCDSVFNQTLTESMEVVSNYPFAVPSKYLQELSLDTKGIDDLSKPVFNPRRYPVIVTGASSNHFKESQGMIKTFHQLLTIHKGLKLIYYDLGLSKEQLADLQTYCKCEVRKYETSKYPPQAADLMTYVWKPILIQTVLKEYDFVMWSDVSVRYTGNPIDELSKRARQRGLQTQRGGGAIMERTSKRTFDFLKETPCLYNTPEVPGGWSVISRNRFTLEYIMKPWVSCGLTENCMTYKNSTADLNCGGSGHKRLHKCHRFDQSMLGILVNRLFHEQRSVVEANWAQVMQITQGAQSNYFEELKRQTKKSKRK